MKAGSILVVTVTLAVFGLATGVYIHFRGGLHLNYVKEYRSTDGSRIRVLTVASTGVGCGFTAIASAPIESIPIDTKDALIKSIVIHLGNSVIRLDMRKVEHSGTRGLAVSLEDSHTAVGAPCVPGSDLYVLQSVLATKDIIEQPAIIALALATPARIANNIGPKDVKDGPKDVKDSP